jgi:tetratricopeptide (TPR) repeat protein
LVTRHTAAGKTKAALALLDQILAENPLDVQAWSQAARVCAFAGDVTAAQACITAGKAAAEKIPGAVEKNAALLDVQNDSATMLLLLGKPLEALRAFEGLERQFKLDHQGFRNPELASNKALCHAYAGSLSGARRQLDSEFSQTPQLDMLQEAIVSNVATLYEVVPPVVPPGEGGTTGAGMAKRKLGAWVAAAAPDDFDLTCAKMQGPAGSM